MNPMRNIENHVCIAHPKGRGKLIESQTVKGGFRGGVIPVWGVCFYIRSKLFQQGIDVRMKATIGFHNQWYYRSF
jgi:hypothetical protein